MSGIDLLPGFDRFSKWLWEPLGGEPAAANHEPGYVEIPPEVRPPRRAHGPRTVDGFRPAVLRAYAAAQHYLCDGGTLAEAALTYDSNAHYVRGAIELLGGTRWPCWMRRRTATFRCWWRRTKPTRPRPLQ